MAESSHERLLGAALAELHLLYVCLKNGSSVSLHPVRSPAEEITH